MLGVASPVLWSLVWGYGVPSAGMGSPAPPPPAGAQSPDQQELLARHGPARPVFVEGPFPLWLRSTRLSYYVLRGDPLPPHLRVSPMDPGAQEGMGGDWTKSPIAWDEMKGQGAPTTLEGVGWATHGRRGFRLAQDKREWDPHGPGEEGREGGNSLAQDRRGPPWPQRGGDPWPVRVGGDALPPPGGPPRPRAQPVLPPAP